ncbi:hypothetical protein KFK09_021221 [Dendrobium nobile]|uniref:Uncharacterized protein n=1 Tax=Dendrobium nobile TaxID=94219 RepID=A0A8T3APE9_DENNO|nr:hypothetical protein KFK09_021221 [Dendrobium nobile]
MLLYYLHCKSLGHSKSECLILHPHLSKSHTNRDIPPTITEPVKNVSPPGMPNEDVVVELESNQCFVNSVVCPFVFPGVGCHDSAIIVATLRGGKALVLNEDNIVLMMNEFDVGNVVGLTDEGVGSPMPLLNAVGEEDKVTLNNCMVNCINDGGKDVVVNLDSAALELVATIPLGSPSENVNVGVFNDVSSLGVGCHDSIGAFSDGSVVGEVVSPVVIIGNEVSLGVVAIHPSIVSHVSPIDRLVLGYEDCGHSGEVSITSVGPEFFPIV